MYRKMVSLVLGLAVLFALSACGGVKETENKGTDKLKVAVSFNAMQEFVQAVGGDKVDVKAIIPDGIEPHDFEPKAQDLVALHTSKVFIYSGLGMEPWAEEAVKAADNPELTVAEASKGAEPIKNTDPEEVEEHGQYDPHLWLSIKGAQVAVNNIAAALAEADPANKNFYQKNRDEYIRQLEELYGEYNTKFASVTNKSFVTGHAAFAYFCRDFGLKQNSVEDVFAEGEPTAANLAELVQYCKENKVKTIFVEEMVSPEVSKTLADEVGAATKTIYTMESNEENKSYLDRMKSNLEEIYESLSKQ